MADMRFLESHPDDARHGIVAIDLAATDPALAGTSQDVMNVSLRFRSA